jgi:hypothetical protein
MRDTTQMADASESLFELWIDRATHTRWETVLTPAMQSHAQRWRTPGEGSGALDP